MLCGLCFLAAAMLGLAVSRGADGIAAFWPANGILLSALLLAKTGTFWRYVTSCTIAGLVSNSWAGADPGLVLAFTAANLLTVGIAYRYLSRTGFGRDGFESVGGVVRFLTAIALAVPPGAGLAAVAVSLHGGDGGAAWLNWAASDVIGIVLIVSLVLTTARHFADKDHDQAEPLSLKFAMDLLAVLLTACAVFLQTRFPLLFLPLAILLLVTYRSGLIGAASGTMIIAITGAILTATGKGPVSLVQGDTALRIQFFQIYLVVIYGTCLPLALLLAERSRLTRRLSDSDRQHRRILDRSRQVIFETDLNGRWTYLNPAWAVLSGSTVEDSIGRSFLSAIVPDDREVALQRLKPLYAHETDECYQEVRYLHPDRQERWAAVRSHLLVDEAGSVVGTYGTLHDVTVRRQAEEARNKSERLYRLLADHSNDMIVRIGLDGLRRYVSPASYALLGYRPDEMIGAAPVAVIHVEDRARAIATCQTLLEGAENPICTYRQQHKDGHYVWLEASYRLIRNEAGEPTELVASVRDINLRQAVEREAADATARLQENNRLFGMASSLAHVGHWQVDLVRNDVMWSDEVYHIHGVGRDHVPTVENGIAFYHPDDRERVSRFVNLAAETGAPFAFAASLLLEDGSIKNVAVQGQAERAPNNDVIGIFGVMQDITAQAQAQAALAHREAQYRLLADNATDVVLRTDAGGFVVYASPSCAELSGYHPEELVGRHCGGFMHMDDAAIVHEAHVAIITGQKGATTVEYRLRHKDGAWRWLESHMKPWRTPGAEDDGVISAIRNIGRRKELETELIAARDRAESAARVKANFLANMSHEIRTPMNGVLGFTELVLSGELDADQRRHVELIADSGRSMMRLLNDILDVSKIEAGKMGVTHEPVDLRHVSRRCADLMRPIANGKGVVLAARISPNVPERIVGDPLRLRQIMLNLIGNAVKFTEQGSVTVDSFVEGDMLRIEVSDTGIGIAPERLDAIFEQFGQADESTAKTYGGTGLGLSISAQLVRLMNGTITVRSVVDQGTVFSVVLPLQVAAAPETAPGAAVAGGAETAPSQALRPRVLIAEDHDINQVLILAMAERAGMDATIAADGEQAVAMIKEASRSGRPYELVLMDMQMPNVDGLEATRRLRAAGYAPETLPIVALTANAYADDVQACLSAGMQAHLAKPVRVRDLTIVLSRFVSTQVRAVPAKSSMNPKLIERYRTRKTETMQRLDDLAGSDRPSDDLVNEATDLLHKLAGTAAMFGEAALGTLAKQLEDDLLVWSADERAEQLRAALPAMREAA